MYEQRKQTLVELENRNTELEQKFAEVTRMNLEAQKTERQLRDELSSESLSSHVTSSIFLKVIFDFHAPFSVTSLSLIRLVIIVMIYTGLLIHIISCP